jgi:hypothetical protein
MKGTFTLVTVPFDAPAMFNTMSFTCPVVRGGWSVRLADGTHTR